MTGNHVADVVHIGRDTYQKFLDLETDAEFREAVLSEGFNIQLSFGDVTVSYCTSAAELFGNGTTIAAALHSFIVENRGIDVSKELRATIIHRFQNECLHDGETYFESHGSIEKCSLCHATIDHA